jgi:RHS repeat-associated protein
VLFSLLLRACASGRRLAVAIGRSVLIVAVLAGSLAALPITPAAAAGVEPPSVPVLISPAPGERLGSWETQMFVVRSADPNGDLYKATITVRDSGGAVVGTYETPFTQSDANAFTVAAPKLAINTSYTWTARASDVLGATSSESAPAPFSINGSPTGSEATRRVSVDSQGTQATAAVGLNYVSTSGTPSISRNGRFTAFASKAGNLVPNDTNNSQDIFINDRDTRITTRISVPPGSAQGTTLSSEPVISGDGRWTAYWSNADDIAGGSQGYPDTFVYDRATGVNTLMSELMPGYYQSCLLCVSLVDTTPSPSISENGRFVAFASTLSSIVPNDTNGGWDVFLRDRDTDGDGVMDEAGATSVERVSVGNGGVQANDWSSHAAVSSDGRYVAFASLASNLVAGDAAGTADVFLRDRVAGTTTLVSRTPAGVPAGANFQNTVSISGDGRFVAFGSGADTLVSGDANQGMDVFVWDRLANSMTRESIGTTGTEAVQTSNSPRLSADGRYIAFESIAPNLVLGDTNGAEDVFVRDRVTGVTTRVSVDSCGGQGIGPSTDAAISPDGRYAAFSSTATNMVWGDTNGLDDAFVHDRWSDELLGGAPVKGETLVGCIPTGVAKSDAIGLEDFYPYKDWNAGPDTVFANMATGNLVVQGTDLDVPGQGLNLRLTRTYNSQRAMHDGPLGRGWTLGVADGEGMLEGLIGALTSLDLGRVAEAVGSEDQFDFYDSDGTRHHFTKGGLQGPGWHSPPGVNLSMADYLDGQGNRWYVATRPDGVSYEFRPSGINYRLISIRDRKGNQLSFAYDGSGRLTTVTDSTGRTITMSWNGDYLSAAQYQSGTATLRTAYNVDAAYGRLLSVTQASGTADARTVSYGYTNGGTGLVSITDPRGGVTSFAGDSGVVTAVVDRGGKTWRLAYGGASCIASAGAANSAVCLTDPEGAVSVWTSSPGRNLIEYADQGDATDSGASRVNRKQFAWAGNRLRKQVDEVGNVAEYQWTGTGQPQQVKVTGNGDPTIETDFAYRMVDAGVGFLSQVRSGAGSADEWVQQFEYDAGGVGNLVSARDPLGNLTSFSYYARGLLKSITDAKNQTTTYGDTALADGGYDQSGFPRRMTDATGASRVLTYDFLGRKTQTVDRLGKTWTDQYDLRGNLVRSTDPLQHAKLQCFDLNNSLVLEVGPRSTAPSCSLDGTDGFSIKTAYDARDLPTSKISASDGQLRKTTYDYYDDGELRTIYEPSSFDAAGNLLADTSKHQKATYLRYPDNRIKSFVDEEGGQSDLAYTGNGGIAVVTDPPSSLGRHSMRYTYNGRGQVVSQLESGHTAATTHAYDIHGEETSVTEPSGSVTTMQYDAGGRLTRTVDANGRVTTRAYDAAGNLTSLTQPTGVGGSTTTSYTYTPRNEISTATDPADAAHVLAYAYDSEGHQRFKYDKHNNVVGRTLEQLWNDDGSMAEAKASFTGTTTGMHRTVYGYDAGQNQTLVTTYLDGAATANASTLSMAYTSADEPKTLTETLYAPNGTSVQSTADYAYGRDGLLASTNRDGLVTSYTYDRAGRERTTTPWGSLGTRSIQYDASGAATQTTLPDGAVLSEGYDLAGRLTNAVLRSPGSVVLAGWENIVYDENDNRRSELMSQRLVDNTLLQGTSTLTYDGLDRMTSFKHGFEQMTTAYTLDDAGNVLTDDASRFAYAGNRLTSRTPVGGLDVDATYSYDDFGNQSTQAETAAGTTSFTYDAAGHPRRTTAPDGSWVEYVYDGYNRLVRRQDSYGGVVLLFHAGVADQVEVEKDGAGTVKTRYLLDSSGSPFGNEDATLSGSAGRGYYVIDPRDNVVGMLDQSAAVVATFGYDPFGQDKPALNGAKAKQNSASWDSRLRFQTAPRDEKTKAYSLGGRILDPSINRFVGADQYAAASADMALQTDPLTGNRYMYAGANPPNLIDDGHKPHKAKKAKKWSYKKEYILATNDPSKVNTDFAKEVMGWLQTDPKRYFPFKLGGDFPQISLGGQVCTIPLGSECRNVRVDDVGPQYFRFESLPGHIQPAGAHISFFIGLVTDVKGNQHLFLRVHAFGDSGGGFKQWARDLFAGDLWGGLALALRHDLYLGGRPRTRGGGGGAAAKRM